MRKLLPLILTFMLFLFVALPVSAATLTVETIGGISVGTVVPTSWTHTGTNPIIAGNASPSAAVQVSVDGTAYSTYANTLGDWTFTPTTLTTSGAHEMVISSGIENLIFTLNLTASGVGGAATTTASSSSTSSQPVLPTALPSSGSPTTLFFMVGGMIILGLGAVTFAKLPGYLEEEL